MVKPCANVIDEGNDNFCQKIDYARFVSKLK